MAKAQTNGTAEFSDLREIALRLFESSPGLANLADARKVARSAFTNAKAFFDIAEAIANGEPIVPPETELERLLDDGFAPNLGPRHPVNLKSKRFGNAETLALYNELVAEVKAGKPERYVKQCRENMAREKAKE
jgi:hypothetical protein